jgi:hypothetical protein
MYWKMLIAETVAMAMLAAVLLTLRDHWRMRAALPRRAWLLLLPLVLMAWGVWLVIAEAKQIR